jgi:hypothetical protein
MLKLFQSIFGGGEERGHYPESLIDAAIERAVDGTDPRLRALSGYKKQLRPNIIRAIDHVVALVDNIPAPISAGRSGYSADPRLAALFASPDHMLEMFSNDAALNEFRASPAGGAGRVIALLLAERIEKNVLGMELNNDRLQREVAQVSVSFRNHRLLEPANDEADTRRQLKRRAFDHLLTLALARVAEVQGKHAELTRQRALLQRKLKALERGGWSFEAVEGGRPDPESLNAELQEIETELTNLGIDTDVLQSRMDIVTGLLGQAGQQLWAEDIVMHLDRMNIQRDERDASARRIALQELRNARGQRLVMLLVSLTPGELPQREDVISAAERYLGMRS